MSFFFLIKQDILTYLEDVPEINIIGFIRFRLATYKKMLSELVEKVIKDYRLQKEYKEFITMLRFFVNTQKNRSNKQTAAFLFHKSHKINFRFMKKK